MNKFILYLVFLIILTSCGNSCPKDNPIYKTNDTTYFYTSEGIKAPINGVINSGEKVYVLGTGNSKFWWRICYEGKNGFLMKKHLVYVDENQKSLSFLNRLEDSSSIQFFIIYLLLFGILSFPLAFFVGKNRKIGFWFSFIHGILLTPFVSWLPVILSRKKSNEANLSKSLRILGKVVGVLLIIGALFGILFNANATKDNFIPYFMAFGLISYGVYLLK